MAPNVKDPVAEALVAEVMEMAGGNTTEGIRVALRERRERPLLGHGADERTELALRFLETEVRPTVDDPVRP